MDCYYCDYLRKLMNDNESCTSDNFICEFANYIFPENIEDLSIEYPCSMLELNIDNKVGAN